MAMRVAAAIASIVFALAVAVQFNDPDPLLWAAVYGSVAILSMAAACKRYFPRATVVLMLVYLAGVLWMSPNLLQTSAAAFSSVGMQSVQHELVRETCGLMLCLVWTVVLWWHIGRIK